MKAKTLYRKLVDSHTVATLDEQNVLLFCDLHVMNEYTSPQAFAGLHEKNREVAMPGQNVAVVSHLQIGLKILSLLDAEKSPARRAF